MRTWTHHPLGGGTYELRVAGDVDVVLNFSTRIRRPSDLIRRYLAITADHHGDQYQCGARPGIDWTALGWIDQADHDTAVDELRRIVTGWAGHPLEAAAIAYVNAGKQTAGIPPRPPYTLEQVAELHSLLQRAPHVVHQDALAEEATP